ncbi:MAG: glycoside hydrolase family 26 protein [Proteobacteria bacterium]|nr:glycoside hydrolase family 26 protein [Pseudomonadota bacterium]MBU1648779.1 glycoside hydrolase family 26 protein [Pseudomonadota bacterium]
MKVMITRGSFISIKIVVWLVAVLFSCGVLCAGCQHEEPARVNDDGPKELSMPDKGAYTGAYVDFGEGEGNVTFDAITAFEQMSGKHLAIIGFGNFWGEQVFPVKAVKIVSGYGAIPLIYWSPWDRPYVEYQRPDRFKLPDILAGKWDIYIDQWADAARNYGKPIMVSWGLEMNGTWFPWSGSYFGGGRVTGHKDGHPLYAGPELVKKAYRYVVDRVRSRKAVNILWGFHVNHYGMPQKSWNKIANYYPGADYVDWLGLSVYGKMLRSEDWASFYDVMESSYQEICRLDPLKPVILAEWGVGEFPPASKAEFFTKAFADLETRYPRVKGAVYWHERWENKDGSFSNLHINSSPEALDAYRNGLAAPYWIDRPHFRSRQNPEQQPLKRR